MSESTHVGPIVFTDETARAQIVEHFECVTFRTDDRTTGETWWRESRLGEKEGDCLVAHIEAVDPTDESTLEPYRERSGFATVGDWEAIAELNGAMGSGHLYRVTTDSETK